MDNKLTKWIKPWIFQLVHTNIKSQQNVAPLHYGEIVTFRNFAPGYAWSPKLKMFWFYFLNLQIRINKTNWTDRCFYMKLEILINFVLLSDEGDWYGIHNIKKILIFFLNLDPPPLHLDRPTYKIICNLKSMYEWISIKFLIHFKAGHADRWDMIGEGR